jgi:prepilin-type N-terminal cleavage/methylation domain-containing protein
MKPRLAFSLVELLVVIAIVGILAALLLPVLKRAKEAALDSHEASALRQLAAGHSLYLGDFDDKEPGSTVPLIRGNYAPAVLVASPLDPFPNGWANTHRTLDGPEPPTKYKDSYLTLASVAGSRFFPAFRESQNGGWLVSAGSNLVRLREDVVFHPVRYKRLTYAGGIIRRAFPVTRRQDGTSSVYLDRCFSDEEVIPVP